MNKIISTALSLFLLLGITTACDPLGIEPTSKVDEDRYWQNPQLIRAYVNDFYTISATAAGHNFQSEQWSDNCQGNFEQDWNTYRQNSFNQRRYDENTVVDGLTNSNPTMWVKHYRNVRAVNLGIQKISESKILLAPLQHQLLGESYFFRAFVYFDMIKFYGTVPYVDKPLSVSDNTYIPQSKREELFDYILADLDIAATHFDKNSELGGSTPSTGQINKDVAIAFKSRVALYAANAADASAKNIHTDDPKQLFVFTKNSTHYYEIAYQAANSLIGKYSLATNYADLFTKDNAHTNQESIWPVMFKENQRSGFNPTAINGPDGTYYGATDALKNEWNMRSGLFPTQDLVDCYLQKDEADGKWKNWWETSQMKDGLNATNVAGEIKGTGVDYRKMYENRDKRFYSTITYDGAYMGPENDHRYIIQTWIDNTNPATSLKYSSLHTGYRYQDNLTTVPINRSSAQTISGYYSRKYSHFDRYNDNGTLNTTQRQTCYFNIRYAEVLLNCAEASIKLGKGDAKTHIDEIRNRAGLPAYAGNDLWEEMKVQRRLEFAFESPGFRYFDLLRWAEAEGKTTIKELNTPSRGIKIYRKGVESEKTGENGYPLAVGETGYFVPHFETYLMDFSNYERQFDNARFYFLPHPLSTLNDYRELQQNPGWKNYNYNK